MADRVPLLAKSVGASKKVGVQNGGRPPPSIGGARGRGLWVCRIGGGTKWRQVVSARMREGEPNGSLAKTVMGKGKGIKKLRQVESLAIERPMGR